LRDELGGHRGSVRLVPGEEGVAERPPGGVEDHRDAPRLLDPQELRQHRREAVDRVGRKPTRVGEARDGVEGAVDVTTAVDQIPRRHRCGGAYHRPSVATKNAWFYKERSRLKP